MTSTVHTAESLVDRARGLRDIVMAEAANEAAPVRNRRRVRPNMTLTSWPDLSTRSQCQFRYCGIV